MPSTRTAELGNFLRSRRDRVQPEDVGLLGGGRRRVAGLRREEVAVLANVGTTWYTWLEQGRDVHPSLEVLGAIADALQLNRDERSHLFHLGGFPDHAVDACPSDIARRLQVLVDSVSPHPALVHDNLYRTRSWNQTYRFLIDDLEAYPPEQRNCALLAFTDPVWMAGHADLDAHRRLVTGKLRAAYAETMDDPEWPALLGRLRRSEEFCRLWDSGYVVREARDVKHVLSRHVGALSLHSISLTVQENRRLRLLVHQPADALSAERLDVLAARIASGEIDGPAGLTLVAAR